MKPPHELDERLVVAESMGPHAVWDIVRNVLIGLLFGRLGETVLGRVGSSAPLDHPHAKHAQDALWKHLADDGANGDESLPMPLCLVLNCEDDEIGKVDDVPDCRRPRQGPKCASTSNERNVCGDEEHEVHFPPRTPLYISLVQHQTMGRLAGGLIHLGEIEPCRDHRSSSLRSEDGTLSIVSSIDPKGRWLRGLESNQPTELVLQQPSRCSDPQLKVRPEVFGTVLLGALGGTVGEGNEFSQLDPWKRTLPSSSLKQVPWFSFLVKTTSKACNIKNNNNR
ncbi:hypothetical protein GOBAR_AA40065 [Gossypium barbadense]|uniref:Uncharacterized protein n=1 Tax=Gossypium barbadense TaxID=3634 RepID=A0A2P5VP71_GOSBA|nr:hypothetical protein GOBAR_AA40065 [Gossypium barbadense]